MFLPLFSSRQEHVTNEECALTIRHRLRCRARLTSTKAKTNPMMKKKKKRKKKKKKQSRGIMAVVSMKQVSEGRAYLSTRWKKVGR